MKSRKGLVSWMVALALLLLAAPLMAQNRYGGYYDDDQWLDDLVAPLALYPDDVLAIALPASTYPDDLRDASDFLRDAQGDSYAQPNPDWDQSVHYLLNYPDVVYKMDEDPQWTADLGSAFASDDRAVMEAIQRMRWRAYEGGFLRSDRRQRVIIDDGRIRIVSTNPEYVYIPNYDRSIFYSRPAGWSYDYYETAYPVYYYPYASDYRFGRPFYGGESAWGIDWWGWDIASGIILDWAFWHRSHHDDFYGWQRDWSRHRESSERSPYWRSVGTSISRQPLSAQVRPLQHPIARPVNLPPRPERPAPLAGRPIRPVTQPLVRPARPERAYPNRYDPNRPDQSRPDQNRPVLDRPALNRPDPNRLDPNRFNPNRPDIGARPERPLRQPQPMVEPVERPMPVARPARDERPMPIVRPERGQPVMQQERDVRPAPLARPMQPVVRPEPNQAEKPVRSEREKKPRDQNDNDDQQDGGQRRGGQRIGG